MKLSANLKHEIKLHMFFCKAVLPAAVFTALGFSVPVFDAVPLWAKLSFGVLCLVMFYAWWRQCLSPDKKKFTPKWW
jgi:type VI protein secretion system component VasF